VSPSTPPPRTDEYRRRLEAVFTQELDFVGEVLRRFGVPPAEVDDAAQRVFIVLGRKLDQVRLGAERGFLFRTAVHVAAHVRRSLARKRELLGEVPELAFEQAGADELIDAGRTRARLERALAKLDTAVRDVVVLSGIEQKTRVEIATALGVPSGTVASRLRRGRAFLQSEIGSSDPLHFL
jgi:RNA polymerase sigma-70 factor (ECF subfamily)